MQLVVEARANGKRAYLARALSVMAVMLATLLMSTALAYATPKYVDYSGYDPYQGAQGATVGGRDGNETFTLTMINPLSQNVTASSGATTDEVTIVTDAEAYVADSEDGSTPAYYYNVVVNPYDYSKDIVFGFDLYGPGGNWVSAEANAKYVNVYTTSDSSKWGADTCVWSASVDNMTATNPKRWTGYYETKIPANTLEDGRTYYYVVTHGIHTSAENRFLNADVVFEFTTDTDVVPTWGSTGGDVLTTYTGTQGLAANVTMTTPSAGSIKTNFTRSNDYNCWYNLIDDAYSYDASKEASFALALDGGGSKHQNEDSWKANNLPYVKVYSNIGYTEASGETEASLTFSDDDLVAEWDSGNGKLAFSGTYASGTSVTGTIPADTLAPDTTYYIVIEPEFSIGGDDGIGKPAVFEFTTDEDTSTYTDYAAQGKSATLLLTGISGDDDGAILSGIVNDTAKNVVTEGVTTTFFNRIRTALAFEDEGGLSFTYKMGGSGSNWPTIESAGTGKVHVYADEALTDVVYTPVAADFSQDATTKAFTVNIPAGTLKGSTNYYLAFDSNIYNKNASQSLGANVVFKFQTVKAAPTTEVDKSMLTDAIAAAQTVLDAAAIGTANGEYPPAAAEALQAAIKTAQDAHDGDALTSTPLVKKATSVLNGAVDTFKASQIFQVKSVVVDQPASGIVAGEGETAHATVTTDPQDDRYTKVTWTASDNITIDANTGVWTSTDWGDSWIKATSVSDSTVSAKADFTIVAPVADYTLTYSYDEANKTAALIGFTCNNKVAIDVVVPSTVEHGGVTYTVTSIPDGNYASMPFAAQPTLVRTLTLPSSMDYVGAYAFRYLSNLQSIDLGGTHTLGVAAFSNCSVEEVNIPDSVTTLSNSTFSGASVKTVTGMKGLTTIPQNAFSSSQLEAIDIPDNVTTIGSAAFSGATKLTDVTGMQGVTSLGTSAFSSCSALVNIELPTKIESIPAQLFQSCTALSDITIPSNIKNIGGYAFYGCTSLSRVNFDTKEADLPTADAGAFGQCNGTILCGYQTATGIPALVDANSAEAANYTTGANFTYENRSYEFTFGIDAATGGAVLTGVSCVDDTLDFCDISIPNTATIDGASYPVTAIGSDALANLGALDTLTFFSTDSAMPAFAATSFTGCANVQVKGFDSASAVEALARNNAGTSAGANGGKNFKWASQTVDLADCTIAAPDQSYTGSALAPVVVSYGEATLVEGTDYTIVYAENTEIGTATYTVTGIGRYDGEVSGTFQIALYVLGYSFDESLYEASVTSFTYNGADQVDVVVPETVEHEGKTYTVTSIANGVQGTYGTQGSFYDPQHKINSVTLPGTLSVIGMNAFQGCSKMQSIDMPGVTTIGNYAFMQCAGLTSMDLSDRVTSLGSQVFYACTGLKEVTGMRGLTSLPDYCFNQCAIESIYIPDNITSFGNGVFSGSQIKNVTGMKGISTLPYYTFSGCTALENFTVPANITSIGRQAFYCASALKSVTIPGSVTSIDGYAFYYCEKLESLTFLTTDTATPTFGGAAFGNCNGVVVHGYTGASTIEKMVQDNSGATVGYTAGANFTFQALDAPVATIGSTGYATLADACAAVRDGQTITLSGDNAESVTIDRPVSFVLDAGGHAFTGAVAAGTGFTLAHDATSYTVTGDIVQATIAPIDDQKFTGNRVRPSVTVTHFGSVLTEGVDYTLGYKNNVNIALASSALPPTVTVYGMGDYSGSLSTTFAIYAPVVKTGLLDRIELATADRDSVIVAKDSSEVLDSAGKWVTSEARDTLDAAIVAAQAVADKGNATQVEVRDALNALKNAQTAFDAAKQNGTRTPEDTWTRLAGDNAFDTMGAIIEEAGFETGGTVLIATSDGYWDALTATGAAGLGKGCVVLTARDALSDQAAAQLRALAPAHVIICGGEGAISTQVFDQVHELTGVDPVRCAGQTATGTACEIFKAAHDVTGGTWATTAIVATNDGYWDALAIAPYAYAKGCPIFLAEGGKSLSDETIKTMVEGGITQVIIVGGEGAVSSGVAKQVEDAHIKVIERLAGKTAVGTSQVIAEFELSQDMSADGMAVATRDGYWDALTGASMCGHDNSVLVLVADDDRSAVSDFVAVHADQIGQGYIFGGDTAVSANTFDALVAATTKS